MQTRTRTDITLGIVAGGRASRLSGLDKAWLERDGRPQVLCIADALSAEVGTLVVSANRSLSRYEAHGLVAIADRRERSGQGPVAALDALSRACTTTWLVTLPVDLVEIPAGLVAALYEARGRDGAYAHDVDGPQPLVALWRITALREALDWAGPASIAVHALHARMQNALVRFDGMRFGNLNTPVDLAAAGIDVAR